ncbi:MAG TPA: amino acid adenylation domain-containing protein [Pyrinomonadaceae bacterium]
MEAIEGYRLSPQQKRLWLQHDSSAAPQLSCVIAIEGPLDPQRLERAIDQLVARHEILRTKFERLAGMEVPVQVIGDKRVTQAGSGPVGLEKVELVRVGEIYQLKLSCSALAADVWSIGNVVSELADLYEGKLLDEVVQYADFSEWQNELLESEEDREARQYWLDQRGKVPAPVVLPLEVAGVARRGHHGFADLTVDGDTVSSLRALAEREGVSLETALLACWQTLMWRLTGEPEIVVSTAFDGRKFEYLQKAIGLFGKNIPISSRFGDSFTISDVVRPLSEKLKTAHKRQEYFAEELVYEATRAAGIGFSYARWPAGVSAGELVWKVEEFESATVGSKLQLECYERGEELWLRVQYDASVYETAEIERLRVRFEQLLSSVIATPDERLRRLEIVGADERRQLLEEWNATTGDYARGLCVHELFEQQVERTPSSIAVSYEGEELSYRELNERANQVAHYLRELGVGPEVVVGLCVERSVEMIVGLLGVLKAGGVYLPLELANPTARIAYMLSDAGAKVLLTQRELVERFAELKVATVCLDEESVPPRGSGWVRWDSYPTTNPINLVNSENLVYIIYTSGSTGQPKGVMVRHSAVVNLHIALQQSIYSQLPSSLRLSVNAPLSFDASVKQVIQLLSGHTIVPVPEDVRLDAVELLAWLRKEKIEVLDCTPGQLRLLVEAGLEVAGDSFQHRDAEKNAETQSKTGGPQNNSLRALLIGGEAIDAALWEQLSELHGIRSYNLYGPTECTVDATVELITAGPPTLGKPLQNTQVYVLGAEQELLPVGVAGELYLGGAGVARGYLKQPELSAQRFVPHPYESGARLYRTGDLVRWNNKGELEYLGRADDQVKIRGNRLELGEVEAAIAEHESVRECVVVAREDEPGNKRLVAYVIARQLRETENGHGRFTVGDGLSVAHHNRNETEYLYHEIFEKQSYVRHGVTLPGARCVFDVGANIGMFTLFAAQHAPQARIYAFEPRAPLCQTLRRNSSTLGERVKVFEHGLGSREEAAQFTYYPRYTMMSGMSEHADAAGERDVIAQYLRNEQAAGVAGAEELLAQADEILAGRFAAEQHECRLRPLSDVIREEAVEWIDLLKVDVQRAEWDVLSGIAEHDWPKIGQVVLEVHDPDEGKGRVADILSLLRKQGYNVNAEQDELLVGTDRWNVYAVREGIKPATNGHEQISSAARSLTGAELCAELRTNLRARLPEYMVPAAIVLLDKLPLTRNGKVDRRALPAPEEVETADDEQSIATLTPVEEMLAGIWSEVLRVKQIKATDNFFDLGGHSLLATQLTSRVREVFQIELPLRTLFEAPVLSDLAARIETVMKAEAGLQTPPLTKAERGAEAPLSFAQQRLWFLDQLEPNSAFYNSSMAVRLSGKLNKDALAQTLTEIVRRHEVLRTSFQTIDGEPRQVVNELSPLPLQETDLSLLADQETEVRRLALKEASAPFDLSHGPLLRVRLLHESDNEHIVLLTMHHIISDGWSLGVFIHEVATLYCAYSEQPGPQTSSPDFLSETEQARTPAVLPELELQYADYAIWQCDWLQGEALDQQMRYWETQLRDLSTLELPTDRPRPPEQSHSGAYHAFSLDAQLSIDLKELSRGENSTLFMTLLTVWQLLLARYSGQSDIVVGAPIAGRTHRELEPLIGFFVNTLVLRTQITPAENFRALLAQVKSVCLGAYAHQDVPFEKLVDELQPERDLARSPLFQVAFTLQNAPAGVLELPELTLREMASEITPAKFDLMLSVSEDKRGQINGSLIYATDLFDPITIGRMAQHFTQFCGSIIDNTDRPVWQLPLLTVPEQEQLQTWNATEKTYPPHTSLHKLIEQQVARTPEAVAVSFESEQLTYCELNQRANQLAHHLREPGVQPDQLVGIAMERSVELVVALLAVLKAGAAYVPLDPEYPRERLAFMLQDADVAVLLTQSSLLTRLPELRAKTICVDSESTEIAKANDGNLNIPIDPDNLAYVIYTSGSTGTPKGAMNSQRAICNRLLWMQDAFQLTEHDRVLQKTPFSFDVSVWEFFWPLLVGAKLVVARPGGHRDSAYLAEVIAEEQITTLHFVPSLLRVWLEEPELDRCKSLRRVICSGEALDHGLQEKFFSLLPEVELHNLYGPTEAAVDVTAWQCDANNPLKTVPIGRPIANLQIHLLDQQLQPVPVGVKGELYIGGIGLARGYWNRTDLTAERFIPDPFSNVPGARLYRSGDEARYLPDGNIDYAGRVDHQVKIRGMRIELGEIAAALEQHAAVKEAVVVAREDVPGEKRLVAYVTGDVGSNDLREYLRERLPDYMVPAAIVRLDQLPLSANGKLDRRALPAPEWNKLTQALRFVPPRTNVEATLATIWSDVLRLERVGISDNFFDLGGDSIHSIQVTARAAANGIRLTTRQLFQNQTIAALAQVAQLIVDEKDARAAWADQGIVTGPVALTPIQHRFFAQERERPDHFNQSIMLRLNTGVRTSWLRAALAALLTHHDALRLRFTRDEADQWQQFNVGVDENVVTLHEVDLSEIRAFNEVTAVAEGVQRSLSLSDGPITRAVLLRSDEMQEARLLLSIHHLAVDGVSWRILIEDLEAAYGQISNGELVQLPVKTSSYQQWAAALTEYATSERLATDARYWQELNLRQHTQLPRDKDGRPNRRADSQYAVTALTREQTTSLLQHTPAVYRTGIQELLLAALAATLTKWIGSNTVIVDLEGHGRDETIADVTRTVGWFTTVYPVQLQVEPGTDIATRIKSIKEQLRAVPEGGLGYGVQGYLQSAAAPIEAEVLFNYLGQLDHVLGMNLDGLITGAASESVGALEDPEAERQYLLEINGSVTEGCLKLRWSYSGEQYEPETIERVAEQYRQELTRFIEHCSEQDAGGRTPSDYPLAHLTQSQVDELAGDGRSIEDIYPATPLQEGMLYQTFMDQQSSGLFDQSSFVIEGQLDGPAFMAAAQEVVDKHASLRTAFVWDGIAEPLQVVQSSSVLPVVEHDWRKLTTTEQQDRWQQFRIEDEQQGFDLSAAPLMRLSLARVEEAVYWLLWSHHHLSLDGWCQMLLMKDLLAAYERRCGVESASNGVTSRPYRDYVTWLQQQNLEQAESYWRKSLDGFTEPTSLPLGRRPESNIDGPLFGDRKISITPELSQHLQERTRREQVTLNTVLQGVWALLLSRYSNQRDVVFGATVSGRPAELAGVEEMIGLFINTLPVRVRMEDERNVWDWLRDLQDRQIEMREYEYSAPGQVQQWSEAPSGQGLFETLLVYENFPYQMDEEQVPGLRIRKMAKPVRTKYPLTVVAGMGSELEVYVSYQRRRFSDDQIEILTTLFGKLLDQFANEEEWSLAQALEPGEAELRAREEFEAQQREEHERREAEAAAVAVQDPILDLVRKAIGEVLGVAEVGNEDNFFELGGHSLLATQLVSRLREIFNVELPLRTLFEISTPALLARAVEAEMRAAAGVVVPPIQRMSRGMDAPLSFAQERLWFLDQLEPSNAFYNTTIGVRLTGELRKEALQRALDEVVRRHEILRTSFQNREGRALQTVAENATVSITETDLTSLEQVDQQVALRQSAQNEATTPFDLSAGPLLRVHLSRTAVNTHVLLLTMHHIITDAWSMGVLVNEVAALYRAYYDGDESPLPELEVQYADYALWQREWLKDEVLQTQLRYWRNHLRGETRLELPVDKVRPAMPSYRGARHSFVLPNDLSKDLKELSQREGVTLFMTLFAAYNTLLSRYSKQQDIVVGTVVAGRNRRELEPLLGLFINTLALRTNLAGDPNFLELLKRVREVCLGAYAHQDVPFEKLVEDLQPEREAGRSPFFQVTFGLQNSPRDTLELPELELEALDLETERSRFDLTVWVMERAGQLTGEMTYNTDIFAAGTIRSMARRFETLLGSIVKDPTTRLSLLELIPEEEQQQRVKQEQHSVASNVDMLRTVRRVSVTTETSPGRKN